MNVLMNIPAALLIDREIAAYIILRRRIDDRSLPEKIQLAVDNGDFGLMAKTRALPYGFRDLIAAKRVLLSNSIDCRYLSTFFGKVEYLVPDKITGDTKAKKDPVSPLLFIPAEKTPDLFASAYRDTGELYMEFLRRIAPVMPVVPDQSEELDLWAHIVCIHGTGLR